VLESFLKGNVAEVARKYGINPNQPVMLEETVLRKRRHCFLDGDSEPGETSGKEDRWPV